MIALLSIINTIIMSSHTQPLYNDISK